MDVAIVGAGITGLALAISLHNKNVPFVLFEEASEFSVVGAGIGLGPNGMQAMDMIEPRFRSEYEAICTGNKFERDENVFFEGLLLQEGLGIGEGWSSHSTWGSPRYQRKSAHRRELLTVFTKFLPDGCVMFDKKLIDIKHATSGRIILTFADDSTAEAAVVIGSDGIQSIARKFVLEEAYPEQVDPFYTHMYTYRGIIPIEEARAILGDLTDTAKIYFGRDAHCVTYRISEGKEFNFLLSKAQKGAKFPAQEGIIQRVTRDEMLADFDDRDVDHRLLSLLDWASPVRWGLYHHKMTSSYHRCRVALAGDSAHASLPFQAAGASQGIEDALIVSHVLEAVYTQQNTDLFSQLQAALDAYDQVRRPRGQRQVEQSAECGLLVNFQHPVGGTDMTKILPLLQQGRFDWLWFHNLRVDLDHADEIMSEKRLTP